MEKHKNKALENECLCSKCAFRFQCFTQERVFSDPILQGLFEALIAKGKTREEALDEVTNEIKFRIPSSVPHVDITPYIGPYTYPGSAPQSPWTIISGGLTNGTNWACDYVDIDSVGNGMYQVNYTMVDGEKVSWYAKGD